MKTKAQLQEEIYALVRLGRQYRSDLQAQASIQSQIDVLMWASNYECVLPAH